STTLSPDGSLRRGGREAAGQHFEPFVELVVGDRQRRQESNDVAEGAGGNQDDAALGREPDDLVRFVLGGFARGSIRDQLDANHGAAAADVADEQGRGGPFARPRLRSEEHTSELQSQSNLVCRLL